MRSLKCAEGIGFRLLSKLTSTSGFNPDKSLAWNHKFLAFKQGTRDLAYDKMVDLHSREKRFLSSYYSVMDLVFWYYAAVYSQHIDFVNKGNYRVPSYRCCRSSQASELFKTIHYLQQLLLNLILKKVFIT